MVPMWRASLLVVSFALASGAVVGSAAAQQPQGAQGTQARPRAARSARAERAAVRTPTMPADSGSPRAMARDWVGADDPRCDDLCQREQMMDRKYGKDRERLPAARRAPAPR